MTQPDLARLEGLVASIGDVGSNKLSGVACVHGMDSKFCPMRGCYPDPEEMTDEVLAAPPAVERALHPALPLIEAIAKWERENGTLAAIMPSEYGDFCRLMADAAVHGSVRAVTLHPSDREAIAAVIRDYSPKPLGKEWPLNAADAILALSGSLANPTEKDPS